MAGRGERFINNLDFQFLINTIELDLSHIYGRGVYPTKNDINTFITDDLKVTAGMIIGTQSHPRFPKVFLQFEKEEYVAAVETRLEGGKMMSGKNIKIFGYRCDRPMVTIVLNGQDMSIEREEIVRVMTKYGTVVNCERGKNNDLSTDKKFVTDGTWLVRLTPSLRTKPPETIYYFGPSGTPQTWICSFDGMGSSCVLCGRQGHKGFRCNALAPKGGVGKKPDGLGKWTDIVHYQKAPVQDDVDEQAAVAPVPDVSAPGGGAAAVAVAGQAVVTPDQAGIPVSQADRAMLDRMAVLDSLTRTSGWGTQVQMPHPAPRSRNTALKEVQVDRNVAPNIPGLPPNNKEWDTVDKKKKKGKNKKKDKPEGEVIAISDRYKALSDPEEASDGDNSDDEEHNEPTKKRVKAITLRMRQKSSVMSGYGLRRSFSVGDFLKEKKDNKRPNSASEDRGKEKKKKTLANHVPKTNLDSIEKKNAGSEEVVGTNVPDTNEASVGQNSGVSTSTRNDFTTSHDQDDTSKELDTTDVTDGIDKSKSVTPVGVGNLVKDYEKKMDVGKEGLGLDESTSDDKEVALDDSEDVEIAKKAAKIKEQLAANSEVIDDPLSVSTMDIANILL